MLCLGVEGAARGPAAVGGCFGGRPGL